MKKTIIFLAVTVLLLMLLTACGPSVPDEKQIMADIGNSEYITGYLKNGYTITGVAVSKRQTSKKDDFDKVWADVEIQNDYATGTVHCVVVYGLYNDGWLCDSVEENSEEKAEIELCELSDEKAMMFVGDDFTLQSNEFDGEEKKIYLVASKEEQHRFCTTTVTKTVRIYVDASWGGQLVVDEQRTEADHDWNVIGTYNVCSADNTIVGQASITLFDPDSMRAEMKWTNSIGNAYDTFKILDARSMSSGQYYIDYVIGSGSSDGERIVKYGYTVKPRMVSWSDIRFASNTGRSLLIGRENIYYLSNDYGRSDAKRELYYGPRYGLIPVNQ